MSYELDSRLEKLLDFWKSSGSYYTGDYIDRKIREALGVSEPEPVNRGRTIGVFRGNSIIPVKEYHDAWLQADDSTLLIRCKMDGGLAYETVAVWPAGSYTRAEYLDN